MNIVGNTIDTNTIGLYVIYVVLIVGDVVAGYLGVLDHLVTASILTGIVGHFMGLQVIPPALKDSVVIATPEATLVPIAGKNTIV